jgi:hypothetical protein
MLLLTQAHSRRVPAKLTTHPIHLKSNMITKKQKPNDNKERKNNVPVM